MSNERLRSWAKAVIAMDNGNKMVKNKKIYIFKKIIKKYLKKIF